MCVLFDEDFREKSAKNRDYRRSQAHSNFHCDCGNLTSPSYDASLFTSVFIVTSTPPAAAGIQEFFLRRSSLPAFRHILLISQVVKSVRRPPRESFASFYEADQYRKRSGNDRRESQQEEGSR